MKDSELILEALQEYEGNHFEEKDDDWQSQINRLIERYENEISKEK